MLLYDSKTFYGKTFFDTEDLIESDIDYLVELTYYKTNFTKEDSTVYGVEVVKTEHLTNEVKTEAKRVNLFTKNENKVNEILEILKKRKSNTSRAKRFFKIHISR